MRNVILTLLLFCCIHSYGQDYLKLANDCFEKGDYECAKRNYTLFQTLDGKDMSAQIQIADECMRAMMLADDYFKDEAWVKAKERYQIVWDKNPKDPRAQMQLILCEERLKSENEAKQELEHEEVQKEEEEILQISIEEKEVKPSEQVTLPIKDDKPPVNLNIKKETINKRSVLLFVTGGASIAGGIAASLLLPKTEIKISNNKLVKEKKYSLLYAGAGVVVGGVCIGTGIKIKKKDSIKPKSIDLSYNYYHSPAHSAHYSRLNLVLYGNEAGLCLTF